MADEDRSEDWGNGVARHTFHATVVLAVLYIGGVFAFILLK